MELSINYTFNEEYLPTPRCRKLRYREVEDTMKVFVAEITKQEAPVAFLVTDHRVMINEFEPEDYRIFHNKLWRKVYWRGKCCDTEGLLPIEELHRYIRGVYDWWNKSKEEIQKSYIESANEYLIIDGIIYEKTGEPRYCINTFGLGHNHGGTSMFVDTFYNSNISKDKYFNALDRDKAIAEADRIASNRGDTNDIGKFADGVNIDVLITDAVHCNSQTEHGEGNPFMNRIENLISCSDNSLEAGLLLIAETAQELKSK